MKPLCALPSLRIHSRLFSSHLSQTGKTRAIDVHNIAFSLHPSVSFPRFQYQLCRILIFILETSNRSDLAHGRLGIAFLPMVSLYIHLCSAPLRLDVLVDLPFLKVHEPPALNQIGRISLLVCKRMVSRTHEYPKHVLASQETLFE